MSFFGKKRDAVPFPHAGEFDPEFDAFPRTPAPAPAPTPAAPSMAGNVEVKVLEPKSFGEVAAIANHLLSHRTVILNLENVTPHDMCRRMIDFLTGVAYAINGEIKRVTSTTYIITPDNVDVSNEEAAAAATPAPTPNPAPAADDGIPTITDDAEHYFDGDAN